MNLFAKTHKEIAAAMDVSPNTVAAWSKDNNWPRKTKKGYSIAKIIEWRKTRAEKNAERRGKTDATDIDAAKLRRELLICEKLEIEIGRLNGELITIDDHQHDVGIVAALLPQCLEQMIAKATAEQQPADVIEYLSTAREWVLNRATESLTYAGS